MPDASTDPASWPGGLPDLRHGAGARGGVARFRAERRACRHDAALLDWFGARGSRRRARNGRPSREPADVARGRNVKLDSTRVGDAGRAVGRLAVLRARLGLARQPQPQHVHADRHGDGRRLGLQPDRDRRARPVPAGVSWHGWRCRGLFRGGGGNHRARAARSGPRTARTRTDRRRDPSFARSRS